MSVMGGTVSRPSLVSGIDRPQMSARRSIAATPLADSGRPGAAIGTAVLGSCVMVGLVGCNRQACEAMSCLDIVRRF
ncbi:MAG: hypothetical protein OHK0024_06890 [Thalassobaculales bacterium]